MYVCMISWLLSVELVFSALAALVSGNGWRLVRDNFSTAVLLTHD